MHPRPMEMGRLNPTALVRLTRLSLLFRFLIPHLSLSVLSL